MFFRALVSDDGKQLLLDDKTRFRDEIAQFAGHEVEGELRKYRSRRTSRQNRWMHAAIKPLADHLGYTTEEMKLVGLGEQFGWKEVTGHQIPIRLHTSELNTVEHGELMDWFMQKAAENDIVILLPDEFRKQQRKQARQKAKEAA